MKSRLLNSAFMAAMCFAVATSAMAAGKDPIFNPRAVKHQIDRSAMQIPLQGWTRDLKYPVYPIEIVRGGNATYYVTKGEIVDYNEFTLDKLACEIGKAPEEVLKNAKYTCADGVCFSKDAGAIIGVDPRKTVKKVQC